MIDGGGNPIPAEQIVSFTKNSDFFIVFRNIGSLTEIIIMLLVNSALFRQSGGASCFFLQFLQGDIKRFEEL